MRTLQVNSGAETPRKYETLALDESIDEGASPGQILVMFAIFMIGLMGILGLATDVGFALSAKRSVQGAADSGALAGARMIARYTASSPTSAMTEINAVVAKNTFGSMTPTVKSCEYLKGMFDVISGVSCNQKIPSEAAGIRIKTRGTVKTWFIHIVPGAPKTVKVGGYAKARVQNATQVPSDAPFIICGDKAWDVTSNPNGVGTGIGTTLSLFTSTGPMKVNPAAVGKTFRVHDAQLASKTGVTCGATSAQFTGLADQDKNTNLAVNSWVTYATSGAPGATKTKIDGADGCASGVTAPYNCVMLLPIAKNETASGGKLELHVVGFAAFQITEVNANTHNATLIDDYIMTGTGGGSWCRDCGGAVVVRLIW